MNTKVNISLFSSYTNPMPSCSIPLEGLFSSIAHEEFKNEVEAVRKETVPDKKKQLKAALPAVTISGEFSKREKSALTTHSGFICIDIDGKENPTINDWPKLRNDLGAIKEVAFAALSVSGCGAFAVIPIAYPAKHGQHFDALRSDFASIGITIDKACRDVSRLRGITSDSGAIFNPAANTYCRLAEEPKPARKTAIPIHTGENDLVQLIREIENRGIDITQGYKPWFEVGCAIANELGEAGRAYFHNLSQYNHDYKAGACDRQFTACLRHPGNFTKATIFEYAKQYGVVLKQTSNL